MSIPVNDRRYPLVNYRELQELSSMPKRAALYLTEMSKMHPYQLINYAEIYRNIHLIPAHRRGPPIGDDLFDSTRNQVRACQHYLMRYYGKALITGPLGARASVDDQDIAVCKLPKTIGKMINAVANAQNVVNLVDNNNLIGDAKDWFEDAAGPAVKQASQITTKLLEEAPAPPKALPEKKDE